MLHAQPPTTTTSRHLPSLMVHHQQFQSGHVNSGPTSTSANSSTSISLTTPTTRKNLLPQTSRFSVQKQEHVKGLRSYVSGHIFKRSRMNVHCLKQNVKTSPLSMETYNKTPTTSMRNKNKKKVLQDATTTAVRRLVVEQENSSATSSRMLPNQVASRTIYFVDFKGQTSDGRCFDSLDVNVLQELGYNSTPYYRAIGHPQPRWTETSQQQQFQKWTQDISACEMIHPVIDDALKVK